jgi:hypothetical protein
MITRCTNCNRSLAESSTMIEGDGTVQCCRNCNLFWVKGLDRACKGGPGLLDTLRALAGELKQQKASEEMLQSNRPGLWESVA